MIRVTTESGSVYLVDDDKGFVVQTNPIDSTYRTVGEAYIELGKPAFFDLLNGGFLRTTPVIRIEGGN